MRRNLGLGFGAAAALMVIIVFTWSSLDARQAPMDQVNNAFRTGGFEAAAAVTGNVTRTVGGSDEPGPSTSDQLVRGSSVIVTARLLKSHGVVTPSGRSLRTHYSFEVEEALKNTGSDVRPGASIVVSVLGGRAALAAGRWAQLNVRNTSPLSLGERYLLCLVSIPSDAFDQANGLEELPVDFWPLHGASGIFQLKQDGGVKSLDRKFPNRDILRRFPDSASFVDEMRAAARGSH